MKLLISLSATVLFASPFAFGLNQTGKSPIAICSAYEYQVEKQVGNTRFKRVVLSAKDRTSQFISLVVLETEDLKFEVKGSINSEEEMYLTVTEVKIDEKVAASAGEGVVSLHIGDARKAGRFAAFSCWKESRLKAHYLNGICNADGTAILVGRVRYEIEQLTADCKQLKDMGVF